LGARCPGSRTRGEVLVREQLLPVQSEEAVEGAPSHVLEVGVLATG
jgi:hypothetical protein